MVGNQLKSTLIRECSSKSLITPVKGTWGKVSDDCEVEGRVCMQVHKEIHQGEVNRAAFNSKARHSLIQRFVGPTENNTKANGDRYGRDE